MIGIVKTHASTSSQKNQIKAMLHDITQKFLRKQTWYLTIFSEFCKEQSATSVMIMIPDF